LAVSGDRESRHGIILAKNEIAKSYGVKTAEPIWQAKQKCPNLVTVPPHHYLYEEYSQRINKIYLDYTDQVEKFSVDESWLDVTGSIKLFGDGKTIADTIRKRVREELGITVSIGVSFNKIFAKLGSDMKKPDATTLITSTNYKKLVWPLPVGDLLFVGKATKERLLECGIKTIGELALSNPDEIARMLGKNGLMLRSYARGEDRSEVAAYSSAREIKSIGNSTTTPRDLVTDDEIKITLYALCESVAERMREKGLVCKTVQINLRDSSLITTDRQGKLDYPSCVSSVLFEKAYSLYKESGWTKRPLRTLGVRACDLDEEENLQTSFLPEFEKMQKKEDEERTIDNIRRRFGHFSVQRGIMLSDPDLSGINPKERHTIHPEIFNRKKKSSKGFDIEE
jgi:DNA polymerase-4